MAERDEQLQPYQVNEEDVGRKPTDEELNKHAVAPGRPADVPVGIMYQGAWRRKADGMARHVREQVRALAMYLPVNLASIGPSEVLDHDLEPEALDLAGYLPNVHCSRYPCAIRHIVFNNVDQLRAAVSPAGARLCEAALEELVWESTIVYTSWERDRIADEMVRELNRCGQVWVPCKANYEAFLTSGVLEKRLRVVPYPYDPATHAATKIALPRGKEKVPSGRRFYAIGKWEPRKGYDNLIGAFLLAFKPTDRVSLTLKTFGWGKWKEYPTIQESAKRWVNDPAVVANGWTQKSIAKVFLLLDAQLTDAEITQLHERNNIYVSCSAGEAHDIPAFDSRCAGNSLVHVGYGGSEDYTVDDGERFVRVPHTMGPVHVTYGWEPGAQWAHYRMEDLVEALRKAKPPARRIHPMDFPGRFGRAAVGAVMRDHVLGVVGDMNWELAEELRKAGSFG